MSIEEKIHKYYNNDGLNNTGSNKRVKGEITSKEYWRKQNQESNRKHRHLLLDQLLNEIPFNIEPQQVSQLRHWIDLFNPHWKEFHRQASNETILLALILIQYKQSHPNIRIEKYSITTKYNLTTPVFTLIQNRLIFMLIKHTPLTYTLSNAYDNYILNKNGE